jgi:hypothetical protein
MALAMVQVSNCRMASKVARNNGCVVAAALWCVCEIPIQVIGLASAVSEGDYTSRKPSYAFD